MRTSCNEPGSSASASAKRRRSAKTGMVDRLRQFWNRPLRDRDRMRLFAIAVALIAGATAALTQLQRPTPSTQAHPHDDQPAVVSPGSAPVLPPAASAPPAQPSDEGTRTPVAASRADVAASKRAARRFLAGYLPYTYGHGRAPQIES